MAAPGQLAGTVVVSETSRLQGAELNLVENWCCSCCSRVDLLAGFRYVQLDEGLSIVENLAVLPSIAPPLGGSTFGVLDQFSTHNRFYGGQLGARAEYRRGNWFVNVLGKVALGGTHEVVRIQGATSITPAGGSTTVTPGGLLAQPTNSGHFSRDEFAVVPEVGINVGYQVTRSLRAYIGYTFLYWSDVVRPGDQIDRALNTTQIPTIGGTSTLVGPARPTFVFKDTDFWAQGINFGVEFRY